jgi:hypothetical protein
LTKELHIKEKHVLRRVKERFGLDLSHDEYKLLNKKVETAIPLYQSKIDVNSDFRKISFMDKDIVCIYDTKTNIIKTVLNPIFEGEQPKIGNNYIGTVITKESNGFKVLLDDMGCVGIIHESMVKQDIKKGDKYIFKVLSNRIDKKSNKRRIFFSIQL